MPFLGLRKTKAHWFINNSSGIRAALTIFRLHIEVNNNISSGVDAGRYLGTALRINGKILTVLETRKTVDHTVEQIPQRRFEQEEVPVHIVSQSSHPGHFCER